MVDKSVKKLISPKMSLSYHGEENDFYQAVIEFYGIDVRGPSYEGRVYVNNQDADENTPLDSSSGYVGSFYIFGHDGCWGDEGHCEPLPYRTYDSRVHSHVAPQYKFVDATEAIRKCVKSNSTITVTVVPIISEGSRMSNVKDVISCQRIRVTCYENPAKLKNSV